MRSLRSSSLQGGEYVTARNRTMQCNACMVVCVAYLDDGTMVVVDGARRMINESVDVIVTSVHQTTAGKMIFGRLEERAEQPAPMLRQAAAAGRGDGNGGVRSD